ncbi:unnamed protein product [Rhodiola kirilowii]
MGFLKADGAVYKPVEDVDLGPDSHEIYLKADVKAPRMAGFVVKVFAWFLELRIIGTVLLYILIAKNRVHKLVSYAEMEESPLYVPFHPCEESEEEDDIVCIDPDASPAEKVKQVVASLPSSVDFPKPAFHRWTVMDYSHAYNSGEITPLMVAEQFIAAVRHSSSPSFQMSFFINCNFEDILRQATESTLRYKQGEQISVLDGVPIAVKDEIDCLPYPTTGGTKWLHKVRSCKEDACCVHRIRQCGAVIVGKTNMHELGAGTSGINPHYGATRNPYNKNKVAGGSSSGSAAVVSSGLCPAALGVDGGGSVRMPAALCGVIGFKPTFGCVPHSGVIPLNWTVGMVGVLAGTVEDAFIVYAAISGQLPSDPPSEQKHRVHLPRLRTEGVSNIKLAKYGEWFNDCSDEIRICCSNALNEFNKRYGWEIVEVTIPEIEVMRLAHYLTIGSECSSSISSYLKKVDRAESGWDVRVALSVYGAFKSKEYLNAQRIRNRQMHFHKKIFTKADVIVCPTTGVTAYSIMDDALKTGELDYVNGAALVRYQIAGNFLGLPAVTVPVGYDKAGLPIGLQFIGRPWSEPLLIKIASAVQALYMPEYKKPQVFYDLFSKRELQHTTE